MARRRAEAFRDFETMHLVCRSLGHAWTPVMTTVIRVDRRDVYHALLTCSRCKTEREQNVAPDGEYVGNRTYGYPPGYLLSDAKSWGGRTEFTRNARGELFSRLVQKEGE